MIKVWKKLGTDNTYLKKKVYKINIKAELFSILKTELFL